MGVVRWKSGNEEQPRSQAYGEASGMAEESVARISTKVAVVGAGLLGIRIAGKPDNALRLGGT